MRLSFIFTLIVAGDGTSVCVLAAAPGHDRGRLACSGLRRCARCEPWSSVPACSGPVPLIILPVPAPG